MPNARGLCRQVRPGQQLEADSLRDPRMERSSQMRLQLFRHENGAKSARLQRIMAKMEQSQALANPAPAQPMRKTMGLQSTRGRRKAFVDAIDEYVKGNPNFGKRTVHKIKRVDPVHQPFKKGSAPRMRPGSRCNGTQCNVNSLAIRSPSP
mmetsp:Transcript_27359/g.86724  ORF Transcript_27359/g.86724 Transcript_27359/m.86724 type:complete len:151 (-) Transcript_27359:57-509(-)